MQDSPSILSGLLPVLPIAVGVLVVGYFMLRRARRIGMHSPSRRRREVSASYPHFVFAKIMEPIGPMDRGAKYEDPLDETLELRDAGVVAGGGTQMRKEGGIEWVGIDIYLADLDNALELTRQRLCELGAPNGSVLEYSVGEQKMAVQIA
jgi:hypothetical protein